MTQVSVIIPTYNGGALLAETLSSVAAQTFPNWECFVVDDESTDNTRAIVEGFVARDGRFRYVWQKNAERCEARNRGLRLAQGEYVAFLDHDDLWETTFLEETVAYLDRHPEAGMVFTYGRCLLRSEYKDRICLPDPKDADVYGQVVRSGIFAPVNALLRRNAVVSVGGFRTEWLLAEDYDLWVRFGRKYQMHVLERDLAIYRVHPGNAASGGTGWYYVQRRLMRQLSKDSTFPARYRKIAQRRLRELPRELALVTLRKFVMFPSAHPARMVWWLLVACCYSPGAVWQERWVFSSLVKRLIFSRTPA